MKWKKLATISLLTMLAVASAYGQMRNSLNVNIPFEFGLGNKMLPAGTYEFSHRQGKQWLEVSGGGEKAGMNIPIITLLARDSSSPGSVRVVFDKVGESRFLSEVWLPGEDGLLVHSTAKGHTHEIVSPKK